MKNTQTPLTEADIIVIDDTLDNLRLLTNLLKERNYHVRPVSSGSTAISAAKARPPDLILLDIMMPGMDGYAVCNVLKADELTRDIPVIFISALNETFDKMKAFSLGGVDYITKPFQAEEVLARVETHLSLRFMQQQLQAQNEQLQQEVGERKRAEEALREANASKDIFFSIIAHDLRSPFTALLGYAEMALHYLDHLSQKEMRKYLTQIKSSSESAYALLENLLAWSRFQRGIMEYRPEKIPLHETVDHILHLFLSNAAQKQVTLQNVVPIGILAYADLNMVQTVIRNLVSNALKFTRSGDSVEVAAKQEENQRVEILVSDTGLGIAEDELVNLLRVDVKTSRTGTSGERGTGLGLPLCKDLIAQNAGTLRIDSTPEKEPLYASRCRCFLLKHHLQICLFPT
jgi:signal transduction histidine kinase